MWTASQPPDGDRPGIAPWSRRDVLGIGIVVGLTALLWFAHRRSSAQVMEEGFMVALPTRTLQGAAQGRDFDYFYGPLSLWIPALAYKVLGVSLMVERAVGAAYLALLGSAMYAIGRRWSWWAGVEMGAIVVVLGALTLSALPVTGAIALLVVATAIALSCDRSTASSVAVGIVGALSAGLRPDFALWALVLLATLHLLRLVKPVVWAAFAVGFAPYLVVVARAGWGPTFRTLVSDGSKVSSERRLSWHFAFDAQNLVVGTAFVLIAVGLVLGLVRLRGGDPNRTAKALVALGTIGVCLVPEFLQRPDPFHIVLLILIPFATVPGIVAEGLDAFGWRLRRPVVSEVLAGVAVLVVLVGLSAQLVFRPTLRTLRNLPTGGVSHAVTNHGRTWYYLDKDVAESRTKLVRAADRLPSGETLFVGTSDLAKTSYVDLSFYTLLPQFEQRAHFYDFHPRVALDYGHRLADDVRAADVVVLCDISLDEPNLSRRRGSTEANALILRDFTPVERAGGCTLLHRARGSGTT